MPRDAAATRERILQAAVTEFAAHGLAGGRVERIAQLSGANPRSLYVYFGSKEGLFHAAVSRALHALGAEVPLTPDDLPGFAGLASHDDVHMVESSVPSSPASGCCPTLEADVTRLRLAERPPSPARLSPIAPVPAATPMQRT